MPEFDVLDEYLVPSDLRKQTDFILGLFKEVEAGGAKMAESLKNATQLFDTKGTGTKKMVDEVKQLELTSMNYQKVLVQLGGNMDNLTDSQKKHIQAASEQFKAEETLRAGAKETVNLQKKEIEQNAKLEAGRSSIAQTIAKNNVELKRQNDLRKAEAQIAATQEGSIDRARAVRSRLMLLQQGINLSTEEGIKKSDAYIKKIDQLTEFIKKNADAATKQKLNVGNYQGSAKIIVDALELEKKKLEELEKTRIRVQNAGAAPIGGFAQNQRTTVQGFAGRTAAVEFNTGVQSTIKSIDQLDKEILQSRTVIEGFQKIVEKPTFLNAASQVGDATKELRFFTKSLIELEQAGQGNSEVAIQLRKHLAQLTDQIADAKAEVKALSSDTRTFDLFASSVSFAADTVQTFVGAMTLAGASEKDAAEATKTLVAVQSVANGVKGIANELTTRGTAANKVYAFSQKQIATAFDASATAGARLRAIMATLGFGAIIVGIGLLISNFSKIKDALSGVSREQKLLNQSTEKYNEGAATAIKRVTDVKVAFDLAKQGVISKKEALKVYNDSLGDALGKTNDLAEAEKNLTDKADAYIQITALKAQANELFAISAELTTKAMLAATEDQTSAFDKLSSGLQMYFGNVSGAYTSAAEAQVAGVKKAKDQFTAEADAIMKKGEQLLKSAEDLKSKYNVKTDLLDPQGDGKKGEYNDSILQKQLSDEKRKNDALRQLALDAANERIRIAQGVIANEKSTFQEQLKAIQEIDDQRKLIAGIEYTEAIANEKRVADGKIEIIKKSKAEIAVADQQFNIKIRQANEETLNANHEAEKRAREKAQKQLEEDNKKALEAVEEANQARKDAIDDRFNKEIEALNNKFNAGLLSEEQYNEAREKLEADYHIESLENELQYQKQLIELSSLSDESKKAALREISRVEKELSDAKKKKRAEDKKEDFDEEEYWQRQAQAATEDTFQFIEQLEDQKFDRKFAHLQKERELLEENHNKEIENIRNSTLSEQEKAAAISVLNAKKVAEEKRIAEEERKLKIKKFNQDKVIALAKVAIETAINIVKAYPNPYLMAGAAAAGLAQGTLIASQKPPEYGEGTDNHPGGDAIVGEKKVNGRYKPELIVTPDGKRTYVDKPTYIKNLPVGTKVLTEDQFYLDARKSIANATMQGYGIPDTSTDKTSIEIAQLKAAIYEMGYMTADIFKKRKTVNNFNVTQNSAWLDSVRKTITD